MAPDLTHDHGERIARIEGAVEEIRDAIKAITTAIVDIARLDQKHVDTTLALTRVFDEIKEVKLRVSTIELAMPILNLTSNWVRAGVIGIVALVFMALAALVVK